MRRTGATGAGDDLAKAESAAPAVSPALSASRVTTATDECKALENLAMSSTASIFTFVGFGA